MTVGVTFPKVTPEQPSSRLTRNATIKYPSTLIKKYRRPPYLPPTPYTRGQFNLICAFFPQRQPTQTPLLAHHPHGSLTPLITAVASELPAPPLGTIFTSSPLSLANVVLKWRHYLTKHPTGAPDGTGLRSHLLLCTTSTPSPLLAQWLQAHIHSCTIPAHGAFLATKILCDKVKPHPVTKQLHEVGPPCDLLYTTWWVGSSLFCVGFAFIYSWRAA